ncbi:MAG: polyprenyl synthetase family protein [Desulfurococcales archaeon]|nr:polyprenyl synthetase family protein [Desulfurococcales archaeon]
MELTALDNQQVKDIKKIIVDEWLQAKDMIDDKLKEFSIDKHGQVLEIQRYITEGGKRFRGFLTILTTKALGGDPLEALDAAVAVELVQAASLALDDIVDVDEFRRNKKASWIAHGVSKTVLVSVLIISVAQRIVEKYGFKAIMHVIRAWEQTTRGEVADSFLYPILKPEDYENVAIYKTGALFRLAVILGAISSGEDEYIDILNKYGDSLGLAYQIADDMVDLANVLPDSTKWGDLQSGVRLFVKYLDPNRNWKESEVPDYRYYIERGIEKLKVVIEEAGKLLWSLPDNKYTRALALIPYFMSEKMLEEANLSLGYGF